MFKQVSDYLSGPAAGGKTQLDLFRESTDNVFKAQELLNTARQDEAKAIKDANPGMSKTEMASKMEAWEQTGAAQYKENIKNAKLELLARFPNETFGGLVSTITAGNGRELYEARSLMEDSKVYVSATKQVLPNGTTPDHWANCLRPNFDMKDMLDSPLFLQQKIDLTKKDIAAQDALLQAGVAMAKGEQDIAAAATEYVPKIFLLTWLSLDAAKTALTTASAALDGAWTASTVLAVKLYLKSQSGGGSSKVMADADKLGKDLPAETATPPKRQILGDDDLKEIAKDFEAVGAAQDDWMAKAQVVANKMQKLAETHAQYTDFKIVALKLKEKMQELQDLEAQFQLAATLRQKVPLDTSLPPLPQVKDPEFSEVWMSFISLLSFKILINFSSSSLDQDSSLQSSSSSSSWHVNLFFASASGFSLISFSC